MRLWSLSPAYLDAQGLVAWWREALLARKVLAGKTQGYRRHPQLARFQAQVDPLAAIECYLWGIYQEAESRGYHFDVGKLGVRPRCPKIRVTEGQLEYELNHLRQKVKHRDGEHYQKLCDLKQPQPHPVFKVVPGGIEDWEKIG